MQPRLALTERIVRELAQDIDIKDAVATWWYDPRPSGGLRLTDLGFEVFSKLIELEHWEFEIEPYVLIPRNLLSLDRFMTCPYFLRRYRKQYRLILFGSKESVLANMYGDVEKFIAALQL